MYVYLELIKSKLTSIWKSLKQLEAKEIIFIALLLICILGAIIFSFQTKNYQEQLKNPSAAAQAEQKTLIDAVSQQVSLPKDEKPTIATVLDISELKDQQFFARAKSGNIVLMYQKANRRILYDPNTKKIINDGPIN